MCKSALQPLLFTTMQASVPCVSRFAGLTAGLSARRKCVLLATSGTTNQIFTVNCRKVKTWLEANEIDFAEVDGAELCEHSLARKVAAAQ